MKKQIALFSIVAAALIALPAITRAQDASAPAATTPAPKKHGPMFHGKVSAVDATAKTVTVAGKAGDATYAVTADTKITKEGQPATLADVAVGQMVMGAFKKDDAGKMTATTLTIGGGKKKKAE